MKYQTMINVNKKLTNGWKVDVLKSTSDNTISLQHETTEDNKKQVIDLYYTDDWRTGTKTIKVHVNHYTKSETVDGIWNGSGLGEFKDIVTGLKRKTSSELVKIANSTPLGELLAGVEKPDTHGIIIN